MTVPVYYLKTVLSKIFRRPSEYGGSVAVESDTVLMVGKGRLPGVILRELGEVWRGRWC